MTQKLFLPPSFKKMQISSVGHFPNENTQPTQFNFINKLNMSYNIVSNPKQKEANKSNSSLNENISFAKLSNKKESLKNDQSSSKSSLKVNLHLKSGQKQTETNSNQGQVPETLEANDARSAKFNKLLLSGRGVFGITKRTGQENQDYSKATGRKRRREQETQNGQEQAVEVFAGQLEVEQFFHFEFEQGALVLRDSNDEVSGT